MRSVSVHLCGISVLNILGLILWSSLVLSRSGYQVGASAEVSEVHHKNDIDSELFLTKTEKMAFDKLKAAVYSNLTAYPFIKQDIYLLRWIRAKNLNVNVAIRDMFELLGFLKQNRVTDKILDEDWSDMTESHPFRFDAEDRQHRPIAYGSAGDGWNIRQTILQGKRQRFMRYTYYCVWKLMRKFMEINVKYPNVTQCLLVMNMEGFNVIEHSCPMCITSYIQLLEVYETYVPGYVKEIIVINAPQAYLVLLEILKPVLSPQTRNALRIFSTNKNVWKPYLDERIDPKQLPKYMGGNKVEETLET